MKYDYEKAAVSMKKAVDLERFDKVANTNLSN